MTPAHTIMLWARGAASERSLRRRDTKAMRFITKLLSADGFRPHGQGAAFMLEFPSPTPENLP